MCACLRNEIHLYRYNVRNFELIEYIDCSDYTGKLNQVEVNAAIILTKSAWPGVPLRPVTFTEML